MSRMQGINLVNLYDGNHPTEDQINEYLKYYEITREEYEKCIDKWTNKIVQKNNKTAGGNLLLRLNNSDSCNC